jgi:hypothetical protein
MVKNYLQSKAKIFLIVSEDLFNRDIINMIIPFSGFYDDNRVFAQQGKFTVCLNPLADHAAVIEEAMAEYRSNLFGKLIIPKKLKPEILWRLRRMNVGANALFPGMDGIGKSIAEQFKLQGLNP